MKREALKPTETVSIEIGRSSVHVVICEQRDGVPVFRCRSLPWRQNALSFNSEQGLLELTQTLTLLAKSENLHGCPVTFLLNGRHCVTRSVSGPEDVVLKRLDELESLCSRYLLLGHGRKISSRQVAVDESGKCRGLLSVANERTLRTICRAADKAGVKVGSIHATAVCLPSLIRSVFPLEAQSGVLVYPREPGVDITIVDDGQLLLDVHPVNRITFEDVGKFIGDRAELMQRFFQHNSVRKGNRLETLIVCGSDDQVAVLSTKLQNSGLAIKSLAECLGQFTNEERPERFASGIGASRLLFPDSAENMRPNMLNGLEFSESRPTWQLLASTLWPIAAALLFAAGLSLLVAKEKTLIAEHRLAVERHLDVSEALTAAGNEFDKVGFHFRQLMAIKEQLKAPDINQTIQLIGEAISEDTTLTRIDLDAEGALKLHGACSDQESIFVFVESLGRLPIVRKAALESTTRTARHDDGLIEFNVQLNLQHDMQLAEGELPWQNRN